MNDQFNVIRNLIATNKTEDAIKKLKDIITDRNSNALILLENDYNQYYRARLRYLKPQVELNEINSNLLKLIVAEKEGNVLDIKDQNAKVFTTIVMGDQYNVEKSSGSVGPNYGNITVINNEYLLDYFQKNIDLNALAEELAEIIKVIKINDSKGEHDTVVGNIENAEKAAKDKDISKVVQYLKSAGQWVLDIAKETFKAVAVDAISKVIGVK